MIRAVITAVLVVSSLAHADDRALAKKLYDDGFASFNLAEYGKAIAAWKESYRLSKAPLLLFNLGQAYRLSGDCGQAMTFYESYLREQPAATNLDEVEQVMELCKDVKVSATPVPPSIAARPPPEPIVRDRVATAPGKQIGIALIAGGVGASIAAAYFAITSKQISNRLESVGEWTETEVKDEARGLRAEKRALGFGIAGAIAAAAGTVVVITSYKWRERPARLGVVPTATGAQATFSLRF